MAGLNWRQKTTGHEPYLTKHACIRFPKILKQIVFGNTVFLFGLAIFGKCVISLTLRDLAFLGENVWREIGFEPRHPAILFPVLWAFFAKPAAKDSV